jgi:hypothetical protein
MLSFTLFTRGLILAKSLNIIELVCYTDSLHCINHLKGPTKDLIRQGNVTVCHTLREGNQCADFMSKLGVGLCTEMLYHVSPLANLLYLLRMDAVGTLF